MGGGGALGRAGTPRPPRPRGGCEGPALGRGPSAARRAAAAGAGAAPLGVPGPPWVPGRGERARGGGLG
eukprot:14503225-Alexandrium_andersonii.AAC.1